MGALDDLLQKVKSSILEHSDQQKHTGFNPSNLLSQIGDLFGAHAGSPGTSPHSPRPASEDPYGDPADAQPGAHGKVKPASQDPYGDPADQSRR